MPYPILIRSFGVYAAPVYTYLLMLLLNFSQLSILTARLPSTIFSTLTVLFVFLLVSEVSKNKKLALVSSLLISLSPWHLAFSRSLYETNLALCFYILSILFFFKSFSQKYLLLPCAFFASLAILSYPAHRIITPLTFLLLLFIYQKKILNINNLKIILVSIIFILILLFSTLTIVNTAGFKARFSSTGIGQGNMPIVNEFLSQYFFYLSPRALFSLGDPGGRFSFPDLPPFFLWQLPFYVCGLYLLVKHRKQNQTLFNLVSVLLLVSPIAAALTKDPFSSVRSLPLSIPITIIISFAITSILKNHKFLLLFLTLASLFSLGRIYLSVFRFNDNYRHVSWDYGAQELSQVLSQYKSLPITIDNSRGLLYSQFLFFYRYDPATYQADNSDTTSKNYYDKIPIEPNKKIGNITFRPISWEKDVYQNQIIAGDSLSISDEQIAEHCLSLLHEVYGFSHNILYRIVKTNPEKKLKNYNCF